MTSKVSRTHSQARMLNSLHTWMLQCQSRKERRILPTQLAIIPVPLSSPSSIPRIPMATLSTANTARKWSTSTGWMIAVVTSGHTGSFSTKWMFHMMVCGQPWTSPMVKLLVNSLLLLLLRNRSNPSLIHQESFSLLILLETRPMINHGSTLSGLWLRTQLISCLLFLSSSRLVTTMLRHSLSMLPTSVWLRSTTCTTSTPTLWWMLHPLEPTSRTTTASLSLLAALLPPLASIPPLKRIPITTVPGTLSTLASKVSLDLRCSACHTPALMSAAISHRILHLMRNSA